MCLLVLLRAGMNCHKDSGGELHGGWKSLGISTSFQSCISLCRDLCSNTVMQKYKGNTAWFISIFQQLLCNEEQRQNRHKSKKEPLMHSLRGPGRAKAVLLSTSSLWVMSGRSRQRSLALCRCECPPPPGSPGSAQHSTSGICTRTLSSC